jgi:hypothetical protein
MSELIQSISFKTNKIFIGQWKGNHRENAKNTNKILFFPPEKKNSIKRWS